MMNRYFYAYLFVVALVLAASLAGASTLDRDDEADSQVEFEMDKPKDADLEIYSPEEEVEGDTKIVGCSRGWIRRGKKCYFFSKEAVTWGAAKGICFRKGGSLVKVDDRHENRFLQERVRSVSGTFWLGGHYWKKGLWRWAGRRVNTFMGYSDWALDQPFKQVQHQCAGMWHNECYKWAAFNCRHKLTYICEKKR